MADDNAGHIFADVAEEYLEHRIDRCVAHVKRARYAVIVIALLTLAPLAAEYARDKYVPDMELWYGLAVAGVVTALFITSRWWPLVSFTIAAAVYAVEGVFYMLWIGRLEEIASIGYGKDFYWVMLLTAVLTRLTVLALLVAGIVYSRRLAMLERESGRE